MCDDGYIGAVVVLWSPRCAGLRRGNNNLSPVLPGLYLAKNISQEKQAWSSRGIVKLYIELAWYAV